MVPKQDENQYQNFQMVIHNFYYTPCKTMENNKSFRLLSLSFLHIVDPLDYELEI